MQNDLHVNELWEEFSGILPEERIHSFENAPLHTNTTTGLTHSVLAKLQPKSVEEIQAIVHVAKAQSVFLHPISTGKNWGYSDNTSNMDNCIILDLSLMNKIIDYNSELGYVTVEPGVTQKQLADFLEQNDDKHIISPTGSSPDASIVGNYLERGFGIAPIIDHAAAVTNIHAVLPNGDLYQPFMSRNNCDLASKIYQHDLGPNLDAIFFQSGMGIVTQMTIKLAKKPETSVLILGGVSDAEFDNLLEVIRDIRQAWDIPSLSIKVLSKLYTVAASGISYPEQYLERDTALPDDVVKQLIRDNDLFDKTVTITFSGNIPLCKTMTKELCCRLKPYIIDLRVINRRAYNLALLFQRFLPKYLQVKVPILKSLWNFTQGIPSEGALGLAYWRSGGIGTRNSPLDPAKDGCGLLWYAPIVPLNSTSIRKFIEMIEEVKPIYGINPMFNLTNYTGNYVVGLTALTFNKHSQTQSAHDCYRHLVDEGIANGFPPYRLASVGMDRMFEKNSLQDQIKRCLDPEGIISPGRYTKPQGQHN